MPLPINKTQAVNFEQVSFFFQRAYPVLQQVSFVIASGEFIGIIGPNGGGKTTLLKLMMGFLSPTQGTIYLFNKRLSLRSSLLPLAYVPQAMQFDKAFPITVEEVVLHGLLKKLPWYGCFNKTQKKEAEEALEKVGLAFLKNKAFGTLSGGQAQRVLLARALVSKPELLLLDEPTASVDSQAEAEIYAILKQLKGTMTIIVVTHDLQAILEQVDRVLCVKSRQVVPLQPAQVCEHFSLGLYHSPLQQNNSSQASFSL